MRRILIVMTIALATVACREERPSSTPPATATQPAKVVPQKIPEGTKKEFDIGFVRPNYLKSFTVGRVAGKGAVAQETFKPGDVVRAVANLNVTPPGLGAKVVVLDANEKVVSDEHRLVPEGANEVVFDWINTKRARGSYKLQLFLGADRYAETTISFE